MEENKICKSCFKEKSINNFYKKREYIDGRYSRCIECCKSKVYIIPYNSYVDTGLKTCSGCKVEKPITDFNKRNNRTSGITSKCKKCIIKVFKNRSHISLKNTELKHSYGINLDEYNLILESQKGCCKICNIHYSEFINKKKKYLCVDHCHDKGTIRGLLCDKCNRGIGLLNDSLEILNSAINYLRKYK
jgi:hypothetical protein